MQNYRLPLSLLAIATVVGCASVPPNTSLNEARNEYHAAQNDARVVALAPTELKQAGIALNQANDAARQKENADRVTHLAYLAKQRTAIAQEATKQRQAEIAVTNAAAERNKVRLDARTNEADKAQQKAEAAQRNADASQQKAEASQRNADASQHQAEASQLKADESQRQSEASQLRADESQRESLASQQQAAMSQHQSEMSQQQARDADLRTSQLEAQLKELNAKKTERGLVITLGDVLFDTNKALLKSSGTRSLQKLAAFLKQYPQRKAQIEGYTDSTGSAEYNQGLSSRRANVVRTSLTEMGIDTARLTTRGFGKDSPVASNSTADGRRMNRRVEIILSDDNGVVSSR